MSATYFDQLVFDEYRSYTLVSNKALAEAIQKIVCSHTCFSESSTPSTKPGNFHARFNKRNNNHRKWQDNAPPKTPIKNLRLSCANETCIDVDSYKLITNAMNILSDQNITKVTDIIVKLLTPDTCVSLVNMIQGRCHNEQKFVPLYSSFLDRILLSCSETNKTALTHALLDKYSNWSYVCDDMLAISCDCNKENDSECSIHEYDNLCKQGLYKNKKANFYAILLKCTEISLNIELHSTIQAMREQIDQYLLYNTKFIWYQVEILILQLKLLSYKRDTINPFIQFLSSLPIRSKTKFMLMDI